MVYNYLLYNGTKIKKIFCTSMIPGPRKHKNMDSYLFPLIEEVHVLSHGIPNTPRKMVSPLPSRLTLFSVLAMAQGSQISWEQRLPELQCSHVLVVISMGREE